MTISKDVLRKSVADFNIILAILDFFPPDFEVELFGDVANELYFAPRHLSSFPLVHHWGEWKVGDSQRVAGKVWRGRGRGEERRERGGGRG